MSSISNTYVGSGEKDPVKQNSATRQVIEFLNEPTWTGTNTFIPASGLNQAIVVAQTGTGTSEQLSFNKITITSDNISAGATNPSSDFINGLEVAHTFGGSAAQGGRNAIFGNLTLSSAKSTGDPYNFNAALLGWATANATDSNAFLYGIGATARVKAGKSINGAIAAEFTVGIEATGSAATRAALILDGLGGASVQGTNDCLLALSNQTGSAKFKQGIQIGALAGQHPIDVSNGVIMQTVGAATVLHGIDLTSYTFSGGAYKSPGYSIDGSGNLACSVSATIQTGAQSNVIIAQWSGDTHYNAISLNGSTGSGTLMGLLGGASADQTLYVTAPTSGDIVFRPGGTGSNLVYFRANGGVGLNTTTNPGSGSLAANAYVQTGTVATTSLPAAAAGNKGARYFVSDASAATFGSTFNGGGANNVPVYSDGTNWRVG